MNNMAGRTFGELANVTPVVKLVATMLTILT
jgi:hypothetical protein